MSGIVRIGLTVALVAGLAGVVWSGVGGSRPQRATSTPGLTTMRGQVAVTQPGTATTVGVFAHVPAVGVPARRSPVTRLARRPSTAPSAPPDVDRPPPAGDQPEDVAAWFTVAWCSWRADDPTPPASRTGQYTVAGLAASLDVECAARPPAAGEVAAATVTGRWRPGGGDPAAALVTVTVTQRLFTADTARTVRLEVDATVVFDEGRWLVAAASLRQVP